MSRKFTLVLLGASMALFAGENVFAAESGGCAACQSSQASQDVIPVSSATGKTAPADTRMAARPRTSYRSYSFGSPAPTYSAPRPAPRGNEFRADRKLRGAY